MQEQNSLIKAFDEHDDTLINEYSLETKDKFFLPERNWNGLIDSYNSANKRKFTLTPLECKTIIEYAKQDVPPKEVFRAHGYSAPKYRSMVSQAQEYEEKLQELNSKDSLTDEEFDLFHALLRHPLRVLMSDIDRAQGIADVLNWEKFNQNADNMADVQVFKMKAKFKEFFSEKETQTGGSNVTIVLGGDFVNNL